MTELTVNIDKIIHAPIEKVFNVWLDLKKVVKIYDALHAR